MLKLWIVGASGQIGSAINEVLDPLEMEVFNTDKEELDITDTDEVLNFGVINRPDVIINCAAVTDTDLCEKEPELAYRVNALGARNLSIVARKTGAKMVQISTDDVFDGIRHTPYTEFDDTNPKTVYGRSKRAGENYVKEFTHKHFILRSNWVYGNGNNFVNRVLHAADTKDELLIASDQFGSPTSAKDLAKMIMYLISTNEYGTYHATCQGVCNRYEFAQEVLKLAGKRITLRPVVTSESDLSSTRPAYAVLDNFILRIINVYEMPDWRASLKEYMDALLAGAIFGIILCYAVPSGHIKDDIIVEGVLYVVGQGFIKLMKMLVVPLVFCSLVCGSMSIGDTKKLGTVGARTLIFYLATTALAVTVALSVGNLINPGVGLDMSTIKTNAASVETMKATSLTDTLLNIIPDNPINSLASGEMLQIIVFALIIGVILAKLGERAETVANFFSQFNDIMMEMTMMIMALAPIGVFCLISRTFANIGFSAFVPLAKYMIGVLIALAIQCFGVYQILLKIFTGLNPLKFIKKFFPVMAFAFSTATSNATIPLSIDTLSKKVGVSKKISSFTIPLGATINMDGTSIMQGVAVVFAAQAFGIHLSMTDYITVIGTATLASIGTAGVPSVGLVTLTMVFNSVGLPVEAIGLIMGIDRILDMTRTAVNITGDAVCTTIVAHQNKALDKKVFYETE